MKLELAPYHKEKSCVRCQMGVEESSRLTAFSLNAGTLSQFSFQ